MTLPCVHGFPKPSNCIECMYEGNIEPPRPQPPNRARKAVLASFEGACGGCPVDITPGQLIVSVSGDWWHEDCAEWA